LKIKRFEENKAGIILRGIMRWGMIICSAAIVLILVETVISRYLFDEVIKGYDELLPIFAMWLYFLGAGYGTYEKSHIRADIVDIFVPEGIVKQALNVLADIIMLIVNVVFLLWAVEYVQWSIVNMPKSISLKIPLFIGQSSILVGFALMLFFNIRNFIHTICRFVAICRNGGKALAEPKAEEVTTSGS